MREAAMTAVMPRQVARARSVAALCVVALWTAACGSAAPPADGNASGAAPPAAAAPAAAAPAAPAAAKTQADLFPDGPQKEAVLNNCASCHNLACSVIGQRTAERWDALQKGHADRVADADVAAMFAYLKASFNDSTPEPVVPPAFLEGGCTPF